MTEYIHYYRDDLTHLGLNKQTPREHVAAKSPSLKSKVVAMARLGGLHHRYDMAA
jgi:hypothetical protein